MTQEVFDSMVIGIASKGVDMMYQTAIYRIQEDPVARIREQYYMCLRNILQALENYDIVSGIISDSDIDYLFELAEDILSTCPEGGKGFAWRKSLEITDLDGNVYTSIIIGTQEWIVENLRVTKFADGTPMSYGSSGKYLVYNDDINNAPIYGNLYMNNVITDPKGLVKFFRNGIVETGWRVNKFDDWIKLRTFLGGYGGNNMGKLKETGTNHWNTPNSYASDLYGFKARGAGAYDLWWIPYQYSSLKDKLFLWITDGGENGNVVVMSYDNGEIYTENFTIYDTMISIRCVRDIQ